VGITLAVTFLLGMLIGFPVAISMGGSGFLALLLNGKLSLLTVPQRFFNGINSFPLMAVPFFILAADLMSASGITMSLLRFTNNMVGHIRGGLGHVNILTLMLFAGISGSALADAAGPGALIMRMMKKAGYDEYYSAALTASTAIMGPIIPPSIIMVIYAITDSKVTVAGLFLAGVLPGVLMAIALAALNHITAIRRNYLFRSPLATWKERLQSVWRAVPALLMPVIIIGGILGGIFTATEAAGVGVVYALVVGFLVLRTLKLRDLPEMFMNTAKVTSVVLLLLATTNVLSWIVTMQNVPQITLAFFTSLSKDPRVFLLLFNALLLVTGCVIDTAPAIFLLVPIFAPVAKGYGIDLIHFGVLVTVNLCIGLLTPPVGSCIFIASSLAKISIEELLKPLWPFLVAEIVVLFIITYIPVTVMFLPRLLGY